MVDLDITELIEKATDWVSGLVIIEKLNGKLCIFLDPRILNNAVKQEHLHLPTTKEIFSQVPGGCFFSKLDAFSGYWQIKEDEESSHLLLFCTSLGRYHFKRLFYRIYSASEVFQREITSIIPEALVVLTPKMI